MLPLLTTILTFVIRIASKKDTEPLFNRADFAVGMDISVTAILILFSKCAVVAGSIALNTQKSQQGSELLLEMFSIALGLMFGLFGVTVVVRRLGWDSEKKLKMFWGIILPDIIGVIYLVMVSFKSIKLS